MEKILLGYLVEKDNEEHIVQTVKFSELEAYDIIDAIDEFDASEHDYSYVKLFSKSLTNMLTGANTFGHTYIVNRVCIKGVYDVLKKAYCNTKNTEHELSLNTLMFFDAAYCERNHTYLRFDLTII